MTLLCWLNLVMMDTSMKGFGSVETESRVKDTRLAVRTSLIKATKKLIKRLHLCPERWTLEEELD